MGPDELALLQVLMQSGYTEEQAMQMLSSGALNAPGVAPPAVQQAMSGMPSPMQSYADEYYGDGMPPQVWSHPVIPQYPSPGGGGRGVSVGGVNPNAYMEKERSYGGTARDAQTYGRDFSGDLGSIIRELVNAGRSAAAAQRPSTQRNPSRPSSPGRSASAPGQMKKAAGVQSAKSFTPAATRATTTPTKARTVAPPAPAKVPAKPLIKSSSIPAATRGTAVNTLTKAKSRF
jgi:hypothetical protein